MSNFRDINFYCHKNDEFVQFSECGECPKCESCDMYATLLDDDSIYIDDEEQCA